MIKKLFDNDYSNIVIKKLYLIFTSLIFTSLITRYLGTDLRGEYAFIMSAVNLLVLVFNLGIYHSYAFNRKKREHSPSVLKQKYLNVYTLQFLVYLALPFIIYLTTSNLIYSIASVLVPLNVLAGQLGMMMLIEDLKYRSKAYIVSATVKIIGVTIVYVFFEQYIILSFFIIALHDLLLIILYFFKLRIMPNIFAIDILFIKKAILFGIFPMLTSVFSVMNYNFDMIILKGMVDVSYIGLYSTGVVLAEYLWMIPDIFKEVMFKKSAREDAVEDVKFSVRVSTVLIIFVMIFTILFGKTILSILFGQEFIPAYNVTVILILGVPMMMYYKIIAPLFIADGKTKMNFYTLLASVILNIILNFIFIPYMGIVGSALASVLSYTVCGLIFLRRFQLDYKVKLREIIWINKSDIRKLKKFLQVKAK